jgi:outer membrane lipoprotein carrier protein
MRRVAVVFVALLVSWTPARGAPAAEEASPAQERLRAFLADVRTLEASFRQTLDEEGSREARVSEGRLYLHRPGRFRWDYQRPTQQVVVSDGESLWLYDPDLEQVTVRALDEGLASTPAMLLSGEGELEDSFEIARAYAEGGLDWVELSPREEGGDFAGVRVGFRGDLLAAMEILDSLGQTTRIQFSDVVVNPELDAALFRFEPPEGADVIRDSDF